MTDETTEAEAAPQTSDAPAEAQVEQAPLDEQKIPVKWNGQEIDMSVDEIRSYAQKGVDYERKMQKVGDMRSDLESRASDLKDMEQWKTFLAGNPEKAQQIEAIVDGREYGYPEGEATEENRAQFQQASKIRSLEKQLESLTVEQQQVEVQRHQDRIDTEIKSSIKSSQLLKRANQSAYDAILQRLARDPSQDISTVAKVLEREWQAVADPAPGTEQYAEAKASQSRFGVEGAGGPASVLPPKEFTAKDLEDGGVKKAVLRLLRGQNA